MDSRQKTIEMTGRGKAEKTLRKRITKPAKVSVRGKGRKGRTIKPPYHLARRGVVKQTCVFVYGETQNYKINGYSLTTRKETFMLCTSSIDVRSFSLSSNYGRFPELARVLKTHFACQGSVTLPGELICRF